MTKFVRYFLALVGLGIVALTTALVSGLYRLPVGEIVLVDFPSLTLAQRPNQYLVCPDGFCRTSPHRTSPVYDLTVDELRAKWMPWIATQSGLVLADSRAHGFQVTYVERSRVMGFPDLITVQFVPVGDQQSALAIYSRSLYGYSDFGVNQTRIDRWLEQFKG